MEKKSSHINERSLGIKEVHRCSVYCLGPLAFHTQTKGERIRLSNCGQCAERSANTFQHGLVFSCRTVKVKERIRLRIDKNVFNWSGAIRVGFTNVPPAARAGPLPGMAVPCLTQTPGHWAAPVEESLVRAGSQLEFWVSATGSLHVCINKNIEKKLLTDVDVRRPLWAMIDVYGQTCAITLLGSVKKELFRTRESCIPPDWESAIPSVASFERRDECIPLLDTRTPADKASCEECVVCLGKEARIIVKPCGHKCLCSNCAIRIMDEFGTCPLCRQAIHSGAIAA